MTVENNWKKKKKKKSQIFFRTMYTALSHKKWKRWYEENYEPGLAPEERKEENSPIQEPGPIIQAGPIQEILQEILQEEAGLYKKWKHNMKQGELIGHSLPQHQQESILAFVETFLEKEALERLIRMEEKSLLAEGIRRSESQFRNQLLWTTGGIAAGVAIALYSTRGSFAIGGFQTQPNPGGIVTIYNIGYNKVSVSTLPIIDKAEENPVLGLVQVFKIVYKLVREHVNKN
jgi:hypothetical protein